MIVLNQPADAEAAQGKNQAEEILAKLKAGASFSELAAVYSQGSQRKVGGDWGWGERSRLNKGVSGVAFSLQPGQHSGVLRRSAGDRHWLRLFQNGPPAKGRP